MDKIEFARNFAMLAHGDQKRKWGGGLYYWHPIRVEGIIGAHAEPSDEMRMAAFLHDTVEDVGAITIPVIKTLFGEEIGDLVYELTSVPAGREPRAKRKEFPHPQKGEEKSFGPKGKLKSPTGRYFANRNTWRRGLWPKKVKNPRLARASWLRRLS